MKKLKLLYLLLLSVAFASAQTNLSGTVKGDDGFGIPTVNVVEKGTSNGTTTDFDGNYTLTVSSNATIIFSYVGYETKEVPVNGKTTVDVILSSGEALDEVVLVGSRTAPRSNVDSALPIDVVGTKELTSTGQATFDKALQYRIPSFNTV